MGGAGQRLGHLDYADWARRLEINTLGAVRVIEALSPRILMRGAGRLAVARTSLLGSIAENTSGGWLA